METWTKLPFLHTLNIGNTPIIDAAIEHLKQLKSLRVLELRRTRVSAAAALELQKGLPNCVVLHEALQQSH